MFHQAVCHGLFTVLYSLSVFLMLCYSGVIVVAPVFMGSGLVMIGLVAC